MLLKDRQNIPEKAYPPKLGFLRNPTYSKGRGVNKPSNILDKSGLG
jgi:hypothetical protein